MNRAQRRAAQFAARQAQIAAEVEAMNARYEEAAARGATIIAFPDERAKALVRAYEARKAAQIRKLLRRVA